MNKKLNVKLGYKINVNVKVPAGIKRIAIVNIIPNTRPKNSVSTSL